MIKKLLLFVILFATHNKVFNLDLEFYTEYLEKSLAEGINVLNLQDINGETLLMKFIRSNKKDKENLVKHLINLKPDLDIQNNIGETALIIAAKANLQNIIKLLLEAGADLNLKNKSGQTAKDIMSSYFYSTDLIEECERKSRTNGLKLFDAVEKQDKNKIRSLLKDRANPLILNKIGFNGLTLAITNGYVEGVRTILETLQQLGKKELIRILLTKQDVLKETPLQLAERLAGTASPKEFYQKIEEILIDMAKKISES